MATTLPFYVAKVVS